MRGERVGYNAGMVANASRQIETAKWAILPRADARAGEEKSATVSFWSEGDDNITVSSLSTHGLHGFYDQEPSNVASVDQSNQQYSIYALTDSSVNVSERYAYTAYGQPTFLNASAAVQTSSAAGNRYTYTAREWDSTLGLHHFRARWMSGLTGRFLTRDPIGYVDGTSRYRSYIGLKKTDPTGLETVNQLIDRLDATDGIDGCYTMTLQSFFDWNRNNGSPQPSPEQIVDLYRGCIGFTSANQHCTPKYDDHGYPEDYPNTTCFKTEVEARAINCKQGEIPLYFEKLGTWCNGVEPPDGKPIEPGKGICPMRDRTFNYVTCFDGYCIDMNHCRLNMEGECAKANEPTSGNPRDAQSIRFCKKPMQPGGDFPNAMWCATCKPCRGKDDVIFRKITPLR